MTKKLLIEFPDDWLRRTFAVWLIESGEQSFSDWVDAWWEEEYEGPTPCLVPDYHRKPDGVFCGHEYGGDGPNDTEPKTIQVTAVGDDDG